MPDFDGLPPLPARPSDANKGTFGKVLVVAGSRGMSGAAALAGLGALRGGAGLVELATPIGIQPIVASMEPSWLTMGLPEDDDGRLDARALPLIEQRFDEISSLAIGSGWGLGKGTRALAGALAESCPQPMVIDADGLNALAELPEAWRTAKGPRIITPHPGEFARLTKSTVGQVQADRESNARAYAKAHGLVVVLKGADTVITDGDRLAINSTGNAGLATGGTGDVLTGVISALLAQRMAPFDAARLGAFVHGLAGDLAAAHMSQPGLIASDLPRYLGRAWMILTNRGPATENEVAL